MSRILAVAVIAATLTAPIEGCDRELQERVQAGRQPWMEPVMRGATGIGRPQNVLAALLIAAIQASPAGPATARMALAVLLPTNLAVEGVKRSVGRGRPDGDQKRSNSSFPSSHAANAFALAWVIARRWSRLAAPAMALAGLVAWSRVYLNRHYTSDVVCGAVLGVAIAWWVGRWAASAGQAWIEEGRLRRR